MKRSYFVLLLLLLTGFFTACDPETPGGPLNETEAPEIPPAALYTMPATVLNDVEADTTSGVAQGFRYKNWTHAGINLLVWNTAIVLNVGVPVASFGLALNETPVYVGNATWQWSYVYNAPPSLGAKDYTVSLTGQVINSGSEVEWIMKVSESGGFQDFEWFSGISSTDFSTATFTLNHQPNNPGPYLRIDYSGDPSTGAGEIRYTSVDPGNPGIGGYLEYRNEPGNAFDQAFDINGGPNQTDTYIEIQWKKDDMNGRVKDPKRFSDTEWHCWDTQLRDTDC